VVDFYHYRTGISGYNENLHKTTQIKTKIKKSSLKITLTQKNWIFYCLGTEKMPELQAFLPHWRWAVTHRPGAVVRPKRWLAHRTPLLSSSLFLSISIGFSLISLSVGTKRKEQQEAGEKGGEKEEILRRENCTVLSYVIIIFYFLWFKKFMEGPRVMQ
jgi:hypothetical protein